MKHRNEQRSHKVTGNSVAKLRIALGFAGFSVGSETVRLWDCTVRLSPGETIVTATSERVSQLRRAQGTLKLGRAVVVLTLTCCCPWPPSKEGQKRNRRSFVTSTCVIWRLIWRLSAPSIIISEKCGRWPYQNDSISILGYFYRHSKMSGMQSHLTSAAVSLSQLGLCVKLVADLSLSRNT